MILKSLFSPGSICSLKLKNRIVFPPIATALCEPGGIVSKKLIDYHIARAKGGCGLSIVEISAVHPSTIGEGKLGLGIFDDRFIPGLKKLALSIKIAGGTPAIQIWHAGRQINSKDVLTGFILAPSPIPCPVCKEKPRELTVSEIGELVEAYGDAALRAKEAGFEAVEVHGAHGYLICQFLSNYSNRRDDKYGGSISNRTRFAVEVLKNIKEKTGYRFPVIFRLSSEEFVDRGLDIHQTKQIAGILEGSGADALHISAGNYETLHYVVPPVDVPAGFNVKRAASIKESVNIPVIVAGRINDPLLADQIISEGQADFVSIGRGLLADPDFCNKARNDDFNSVLKCIACNQGCIDRLFYERKHVSCLLNPACGREEEFNTGTVEMPERILVAGGGPGGLTVSRMLSSFGHKVTLCEKSSNFGGQLYLSGVLPGKSIVLEAIKSMVYQAKKSGVRLQMQTVADSRVITEVNPGILIIATGSVPFISEIAAGDSSEKSIEYNPYEKLVSAHDVLRGLKSVGKNVAIIGGGITGIETAEFLANQGKKVTVLEAGNEIARDIGPLRRIFLLEKIKKLGIVILINSKNIRINNNSLEAEIDGVTRRLDEVESMVIASGVKPDCSLREIAEHSKLEYYIIGDADHVGNAMDATFAAADLALKICKLHPEIKPGDEKLSDKTIKDIAAEIVKQIKLELNITEKI